MEYTYSNQPIKRTVIDIPATSKLLKNMRIQNGYSVKQLQEIFGFETPVAVYAWENEKCKNIPCIENFDVLSKLYKCHVEDLYVLKQVEISGLEVHETIPEYGTLANRLLEKLADIEEGYEQELDVTIKQFLSEVVL
jgi:transcriptional regulator with XRE-family HTH domain